MRNGSVPYPIGLFVPKGYCHKFYRGNDCQAAVLDTSVSNVTSFIQPIGVIFVLQSLPLVRNRSLQNRELPTPIQTDKLKPLLDGYDVGLASVLCNGLDLVFHFTLKVLENRFLPVIYFLREKILRLWMLSFQKNWQLIVWLDLLMPLSSQFSRVSLRCCT